ncbi:MAG TPA: alpha/beta hydrolase [Myxococcota bacterium]|nr:alpha/beta hydrolase [Myxococcota bacterium]
MLGLAAFQRRIIFPRYLTHPYPGAGNNIASLERIWIDTSEGKVEGWFIPGDGASAEHPAPLVIFAHGNAELIDYWPEALSGYRHMGVNLLLPEFRGYGRSAGSPSQQAIADDFAKFYDLVVLHPEVDASRVVFHGRSIGGGAVCALAALRRPAAMILQSTFTSLRSMAARFMLPGFLVADPFENIEVVRKLDAPLLVIHGRADDLIPFAQGEKLYAAAQRGKFIAYECDHNGCPPDWDRYWKDIRLWLSEVGILR